MSYMYGILSVVGWAWTALVFGYLRITRESRKESR